MPPDVHEIVKTSLLKEQGYICCYTGIRITSERAHIEHLLPQNQCSAGEDVAYDNLCAAFPQPNVPQYPFGAHAKGGWYDPRIFISPLDAACEQAYIYNLEGEITHNQRWPNGAVMIEKLQLKDGQLNDLRKAKIDEWLFPEDEDLSETKATQLLARLAQRDQQGYWMAFCFVLQQACREYIRRKRLRPSPLTT